MTHAGGDGDVADRQGHSEASNLSDAAVRGDVGAVPREGPSLLGERLLVIGRQVKTPHGKLIDLLAMDGEGNLHVLELKRDKTPRDVVRSGARLRLVGEHPRP